MHWTEKAWLKKPSQSFSASNTGVMLSKKDHRDQDSINGCLLFLFFYICHITRYLCDMTQIDRVYSKRINNNPMLYS